MEIVEILRTLWRRRLFVALGLPFAALVVVLMGTTRPTTTAFAGTRLLSDTSKSQLVYPEPLGSETTGWRAQIAVDSLLTSPMTRQLAQLAGVPEDQLLVVDPVLTAPSLPASLPQRASKAANGAVAGAPYQLAVFVDTVFPLIHVESAAPDLAHARRLVEAATTTIQQMSSDVDDKQVQGIAFEPSGALRTRVTTGGGGRQLAIAAGVTLFAVWTASVAFVSLLLAQRRRVLARKARVRDAMRVSGPVRTRPSGP